VAGSSVFAASSLLAAQSPKERLKPVRGQPSKIVETKICILRLSTESGDLVGISWKNPATEVIQEPRLGENFRILLPRPGLEANYFYSRDQKVSRIEESPTGVTCVCDSLRNDRETVTVNVKYIIEQVKERLEFSIEAIGMKEAGCIANGSINTFKYGAFQVG